MHVRSGSIARSSMAFIVPSNRPDRTMCWLRRMWIRMTALPSACLLFIGSVVFASPGFAQDPAQDLLADAPRQLSMLATLDPASAQCRRVDHAEPSTLASVSLHRTFNDDFNEHPLAHGRWVPHYAG